MNEIKTIIVTFVGGVFTLLAPIENFMYAMLLLFGINFVVGVVSAIVSKEPWSNKKALMFFVYCAVFLVMACSAFIIGHFMGEHEQAVAVVKILCYLAIYVFGVNIFRNLCIITPEHSQWHKLFSLCYYVLSVKFIERFSFIKKWQEEAAKKVPTSNTILDKDDN